MKRLTLVTTLICLCATSWAQHLTEQQVRENIKALQTNSPRRVAARDPHHAVDNLQLAYASKEAAFYVFNQPGEGYLVASAYDNTPVILGYSDEGAFDIESAPESMKWLLSRMERQLPVAAQSSTVHMDIQEPVAPMLGYCNWGQNAPYNFETPVVDGQYCATGCVATAMAMVMNYHQWPKKAKAISQYKLWDDTVVEALPETTFDWKNIKLRYKSDASGDSARAVSHLMRYCGQSMSMNYAPGLSGASDDVTLSMKHYFDYDNNAHFLRAESYTMSEWESIIYEEMKNKRPVIMSGGSYASHEFVCDGYEDGYFHFNWGWDGGQNGFFLLSVLDPLMARNTEYNYTNFFYSDAMAANVGLQPNQHGDINYDKTTEDIETACFFMGNTDVHTYTRSKKSSNFKNVEIQVDFRKYNNFDYKNAEFGAALYEKGQLIKVLFYGDCEEAWNGELHINKKVDFGANLGDGDYAIKSIVRTKGFSDWIIPPGGNAHYIKANIKSNKLTFYYFDPTTMPLDYTINSVEFIGNKYVGNQIGIKLNITNNEEMRGGTIDYYDKDNKQIGWEMVAIEPHQTADVTYFQYFWEPGDYELNFYVSNRYGGQAFLRKEALTIVNPPTYPDLYYIEPTPVGITLDYTDKKNKIKVGNTLTGSIQYLNDNKYTSWGYEYIHLCIGRLEDYTPSDVTTSRQYRTFHAPIKLEPGERGKLDFTFYDIAPGEYFILNRTGLAGVTIVDYASGINPVIENPSDKPLPIYDMQGRIVKNPVQKGIYIQGGKKFVVK